MLLTANIPNSAEAELERQLVDAERRSDAFLERVEAERLQRVRRERYRRNVAALRKP